MKTKRAARAGRTAPPPCSADDAVDAARYRFLRDNVGDGALRRRVHAEVCDWSVNLGDRKRGPWCSQDLYGLDLDREIDAAMFARKPNNSLSGPATASGVGYAGGVGSAKED